ncbi:hypothetical protein JTB14_011328 [Gonioctena quinquepunctata]|nr:hypothetical protein JTB14_011328 [Gonioctena quinquepunctata]
MSESKPVNTPLDPNVKLLKPVGSTTDEEVKVPFRELVGALTYLAVTTRPDISFAASYLEPITEIFGSPELFINMGSTINLTCIVQYAPEPPPNIIWSQNSEVINFDSPRGGISLVTEKGFITTSRLLIQKAGQGDSGLYTCTPSNANTASVRVHILNGEHPAAMHHGHGSLTSLSHFALLLSLVTLLLFRPPT